MKTTALTTLATAAALALTACGGGGGGGGSSESSVVTSTTTTGVSDDYAGTWADATCQVSTVVKAAAGQPGAGSFLRQKRQLVMSKSSATTLSMNIITKFYAVADTGCTGTSLQTETRTAYTGTIGGATKTLPRSGTPVIASKFTVTGAALGGISAGGTVTIGALQYPGNYFTVATNDEYYVYIYESGKFAYTTATGTTLDGASMIKGAPF